HFRTRANGTSRNPRPVNVHRGTLFHHPAFSLPHPSLGAVWKGNSASPAESHKRHSWGCCPSSCEATFPRQPNDSVAHTLRTTGHRAEHRSCLFAPGNPEPASPLPEIACSQLTPDSTPESHQIGSAECC